MRWLATFSWRAQSSQIDQNLRHARGTGVSPVESEKLRKNRSAPPSGAEGALKRNNLYAGATIFYTLGGIRLLTILRLRLMLEQAEMYFSYLLRSSSSFRSPKRSRRRPGPRSSSKPSGSCVRGISWRRIISSTRFGNQNLRTLFCPMPSGRRWTQQVTTARPRNGIREPLI